jgi:starch-binding outer membrane protein, SusD/RagB family
MKLRTFKYISLLTLTLGSVSCDHFLNVNPDNRVELNTIDKAAQLVTNAYSNGSYTFTEWMSDNVSFTFGTRKFPEHDQAYAWLDFTGIEQDTPAGFWNTTYDAIAHSNEVLAVIDNLPGDADKKRAVEAEALLTRAYGHFMLVNLFAKHYDKQTAKSDPGIPYVLEPETVFIKKYNRNTVEEVYDLVEDDFLKALKKVDDSFYQNSGKYHFTKNAALALASRFYLYKGDWANCIKYSNQLLGSDASLFVKDIINYRKIQINPDDYIRLYHQPGDASNILLMRQISNYHVPSYGHWLTRPQYLALYNNNVYNLTDQRADPAWVAGENAIALAKFEMLFERTSITSNVGYNYTIFLAFRGEEVLLNRAESYIQTDELDLAQDDLQKLAEKRYVDSDGNPAAILNLNTLKSYYDTNDDKEALFKYMMEERVKEFMHEGLRWFDLKRYHIPVTHVNADGSSSTLAEDDLRKVIQIPQAAIDVGGLEANPR